MKVLAFGEILWDVIQGVEHLGGAPFNFAAHAAQCGNEAFIVSRLGKDERGRRASELSARYGVDGRFIQWDDQYPTGVVDVTLTNGQPDYFIREDVAWDHIQKVESPPILSGDRLDVFYFGSLVQRAPVSAATLFSILSENTFGHVFYDVNLRKGGFTREGIRESLSRCTIVKLNTDEVRVVSALLTGSVQEVDAFCRELKSSFANIQLVVVTAAEKGCYIFGNTLVAVPGRAVEVRDAVGAGDAFSASFMHVYALTADALQAAKVANQVGAFVATKEGAIPAYPEEIRALLRLRGPSVPD